MPEPPQKFYLTTPIYYVNARPHIGHAYTTIVADVIARRHRLLGHDTFFLTGTDEHGQKIERSAAAAGIPPQQFADQVAASFEDLWKRMGMLDDAFSKDDPLFHRKFIRTTSPEHKRGVQKLWRELESRGFIELRSYTGTYCVSDEAFVDAPAGTPCPECGRILETITEENYFFKLSQFQPQLIDLIESGTLAIEPETRKNEVLSFLRGNVSAYDVPGLRPTAEPGAPSSRDTVAQGGVTLGGTAGFSPRETSMEKEGALAPEVPLLKGLAFSKKGTPYVPGALRDLSISRTSFKWGIPVPGNDKHVIYVWLDALANYMTAIGYGSEDKKEINQFNHYWPADLHLVGKEIIRFHCVYWPAFLLAAGLPLPKKVQAHGWLLFEESKMSKSRGNIVRTETILDAFGDEVYGKQFPESTKQGRDLFASDVLRYFLLREIPFGADGSFSFDALITRYNADLANGYGNLVSRTLAMILKYYPDEKIPQLDQVHDFFSIAERAHIVGAIGFNHDTLQRITNLLSEYQQELDKSFANGLIAIGNLIKWTDEILTQFKPWKERETPEITRYVQAQCLYQAAESIRLVTALLYPILPFSTAKVWAQLGLGNIEEAAKNGKLANLKWGDLEPGTKLGPLAPIFPRAEKGLAQIMTDMEQNNTAPQAPSEKAPLTTDNQQLTTSPTITIDDFAKIDLRAAIILVAERIPKADKLLRLEVDLGNGEKRQILSGIAEHYSPEDLIGRRIVVIANLAPRKMRGLESHGMLLAASETENGKPILATFAEDIAPGSRLK